jgi:hypothetical protein
MNEAKQHRLNGTGERRIDDDWREGEERKDETKGGELRSRLERLGIEPHQPRELYMLCILSDILDDLNRS